MKIGKYNKLTVSRVVDFGVYLTDDGGATEVLLPSKYITSPLQPDDEIEVFVYLDSDDRPVAVTDRPYATVGEFAFLDVAEVNKIGAFLDWGLPKDLLVPYREQRARMKQGGRYLVYLYVDDASHRIAASAKTEKFLDNVMPHYRSGDQVDILVCRRTPVGYACIVDNLHSGMIYDSDIYAPVEIGERCKGAVHKVRQDGKIDVIPGGGAKSRTHNVAELILQRIAAAGGKLDVNDHSSPEEISQKLHCSKKDFKKAVGYLLKAGQIAINDDKTIVSRD